MNKREQLGIVIAIILSVTGGIVMLMWVTNQNQKLNDALSGTSGYTQPSHEQLSQMCHDKLVELQGSEPSEMQMDICVGTLTEHLNK